MRLEPRLAASPLGLTSILMSEPQLGLSSESPGPETHSNDAKKSDAV